FRMVAAPVEPLKTLNQNRHDGQLNAAQRRSCCRWTVVAQWAGFSAAENFPDQYYIHCYPPESVGRNAWFHNVQHSVESDEQSPGCKNHVSEPDGCRKYGLAGHARF